MSKRFGQVEEVLANRSKLQRVVGGGQCVILGVEHGTHLIDLGQATHLHGTVYKADGFFTTRRDLILGLNPADCIGMVLYDKQGSVVGLVHIGRKGASGGIHQKALTHIVEHYNVPLAEVRIFLPPSIHKKSYHFKELPEGLAAEGWKPYIHAGYVDLIGRVKHDLLEMGLQTEQITEDPTDVGAANTPYFSHKLESKHLGPTGRNGIVVRLLPA